MLSDLLIGPSPTCQHGNRKLHRRQLPRNLSPVFRIMKRHPAPAERNHTLRDPLIRLRIPVPDTSLDQPPQKPMMLNKRLQKTIHLRQLPAPEHLLLCLILMLPIDRTHRHHTVDIRHTDRIRPLRHKQSSLPHPISTPYLPVKISMVCHHIRGKKPQPLRKHPAVLPKSRHPIRRQMKQNRPHIPRQKTGRINILRNLLLHSNLHTGLDPLHPPLSRRHIPQRQIRIPIQNTRRKLQLNNPAGQIPPRDLTTLLRLPRKIKKLSPRNIPQIHIHKPLNNLPSPPRLKRRIQKRQNHIITHTLHSPPKPKPRQPQKTTLKTKPTNLRSPHTSHINTHPKPITHPTSTHIRSSSLKPHQHTSEAHLSSHISVHPKLISQVPQNSHQNSGYQSTSQSVNQSGQPSFSIIIIQNTPKINLNITQKHLTLSKTASIPQSPHDKSQKTHPTHIQRSADAPPRWQTVRSSLPPFIPQKKSPQAQTPRNSPKTKQHHLPLRSFLSSLSNRSARAFSLNVFTLSSLRPCSIP